MKSYRAEWLACGLLLAVTWAAFADSLGNAFVNFDDNVYVTANWNLALGWSLEGVLWAFTETRISGHWHPLTWISLAIDFQIWGTNPWGYHLTNLLLHSANVLLLFLLLRWVTRWVWPSAAVAALFAVHPLHVESVAWVTERKDVLSTFFAFLTLHAYLFFLARPQRDRYILLLLGFALALLAKPMVVTLPCLLLLLDYWPLRRWGWSGTEAADSARWGGPASLRRLLLEKAPLVVLSAFSSFMTYFAMTRSGVLKPLPNFSIGARVAHRVVMYAEYLRKMIWPNDLAAFYPMAADPWPGGTVLLAGGVLAAISLLAIVQMRRRPYLLVGWLWYLGALFPVNGPFQVASYAMADRNTYVPLIGIFLALVWGVHDLVPGRWRRPVLIPAMLGIVLGCGVATWVQVQVWRNSLSLWEHALAVTDSNFYAHVQLANALRDEGRAEEALPHYRAAVRIRPEEPRLHYYLGQFLSSRKQYAAAAACLRKAIALSPQEWKYHATLGQALKGLGRTREAEREFNEAQRLSNAARKDQ